MDYTNQSVAHVKNDANDYFCVAHRIIQFKYNSRSIMGILLLSLVSFLDSLG